MTAIVAYQTAAVFVAGAVSSDVIVSGIIAGVFMLMNTVVTYVLTRTQVERRAPARRDLERREVAPKDDAPTRESEQ